MREWFTESERATVVHHCPLPLLTRELGYIAIIWPIELISNRSTSCQCDDGLVRDLDNFLCMVKSVLYVEITQCEQNSRVTFRGHSLPMII